MSDTIHFEQLIRELQQIVGDLEKGELTLEESLTQYEKGMTLAKRCQDILNQAEQKIEMLSAAQGQNE